MEKPVLAPSKCVARPDRATRPSPGSRPRTKLFSLLNSIKPPTGVSFPSPSLGCAISRCALRRHEFAHAFDTNLGAPQKLLSSGNIHEEKSRGRQEMRPPRQSPSSQQ